MTLNLQVVVVVVLHVSKSYPIYDPPEINIFLSMTSPVAPPSGQMVHFYTRKMKCNVRISWNLNFPWGNRFVLIQPQ